jgi:hypothetical protein
MTISHSLVAAATLVALAGAASEAGAQRPTRRQTPIEIRGTVPTPQVTTVRPRAVPTYDRRVLVPDFYDHNFWQSILPAYQLVPARVVTGAPMSPTAPGTTPGAMPTTPPPGGAPTTGAPPVTPPAGAPPARPAGSSSGTAPASSPR